MAKKVLSIQIGDEYTKVCELSYHKNSKKKRNKIYRSISFSTPPGSVEDGFIKQPKVFGGELAIRIRDAKFKSNQVIFTICSSSIKNREVILPEVKRKQIVEDIQTAGYDYFSLDPKDYIFSYHIMERISLSRREKTLQKKQIKYEKKLARAGENEQKALKTKSRTERIADYLEQLEASHHDEILNDEKASLDKDGTDLLHAKRYVRCSLYSAPKALVKDYYSLAKRMHLDVLALDYYGNSSYQAMRRQAKKGFNVYIQMNDKDTLISILNHDVLLLQRVVDYGLSNLLEVVIHQEFYRVNSSEEALKLMNNHNLLTDPSAKTPTLKLGSSWTRGELAAASEVIQAMELKDKVGHMKHQNEQNAMKNIREALHVLVDSIIKTLEYYRTNHKNIVIASFYLTGKVNQLQGIEEYFTSELGVRSKKLIKLRTFRAKRKAKEYRVNPSEFLTCVGAVVKPIDFVPAEFTVQKKNWSGVLVAALFTFLCLATSAGIIYTSYVDYLAAKEELAQLKSHYEDMPKLSGIHVNYEKELSQLQDLIHLEVLTASHDDYISDIIKELEDKLPSGTITNSMEFTEAGLNINLTIRDPKVGANAIIAQTLSQLKSISYFNRNVNMLETSKKEEKGITSVTLSLSCLYTEE